MGYKTLRDVKHFKNVYLSFLSNVIPIFSNAAFTKTYSLRIKRFLRKFQIFQKVFDLKCKNRLGQSLDYTKQGNDLDIRVFLRLRHNRSPYLGQDKPTVFACESWLI